MSIQNKLVDMKLQIRLHPRIVISSEVEKSFLHTRFLAGWLYRFAGFLRYLTLTIFPPARKIPRLRSG